MNPATSEPTAKIYGLKSSTCLGFVYVGKTTDTKKRLKNHQYGQVRNAQLKRWFLEQQNTGGAVLIVLEECPLSKWREREIYWIARLKSEGHALLNLTKGGDGLDFGPLVGALNPSRRPEVRQRLSLLARAQWRDPTFRERASLAIKKSRTPELRARISRVKKERLALPEARTKMSLAAKRRWAQPEYRINKSTSHKRVWTRPGFREKMCSIQKFLWSTPEGKMKRSLSARNSWQRRKNMGSLIND